MKKFKERIDKVWDALKESQQNQEFQLLTTYKKVKHNCKFLKDRREGEYLIKIGKNNKYNWCGEDQQYIDFTYNRSGYFSLSNRDNAQWFKKEEISGWVMKGFVVVKR